MKTTRKMTALAVTLIAFGSFAEEANAALALNFDETSGNTVVTLTATNLNLTGLASTTAPPGISALINPGNGWLVFTGGSDTTTVFETAYEIPTFSFGTGGNNSSATGLSASNPFIYFRGNAGRLIVDNDNPLPANFTATATYAGSFEDNGIATTAQNLTFSNGQTFSISFTAIPEPSALMLGALGTLALFSRRKRV